MLRGGDARLEPRPAADLVVEPGEPAECLLEERRRGRAIGVGQRFRHRAQGQRLIPRTAHRVREPPGPLPIATPVGYAPSAAPVKL